MILSNSASSDRQLYSTDLNDISSHATQGANLSKVPAFVPVAKNRYELIVLLFIYF
jgi:hypothetical protein